MTASMNDNDFDMMKVNRIRSLVSRGGYTVDPIEVADQLLAEHLLFSTLFDPDFLEDDQSDVTDQPAAY